MAVAIPEAMNVIQLVYLLAALASLTFIILLAAKLYSIGIAVMFGILGLIPLVGLIILLSVNNKATQALREAGYEVGFWGASKHPKSF
ncbi:MAG: hypothetical protein AAF333_11705 [Planctomycetota bacterium]